MITTADCKNEIVKHFSSTTLNLRTERNLSTSDINSWIREAKIGNKANGFVRKFLNKTTGMRVNVHSTEDEITKICISEVQFEAAETKGNMKDFLREIYYKIDDANLSANKFFWALPWGKRPTIKYNENGELCDHDGEDVEEEEIDFENHEILGIEEDRMFICVGGDWQPPIQYDVILKNGKLDWDEKKGFEEGFDEGFNMADIKEILGV